MGRPRYTAFVSYRHVEPDRKWAMWLHSAVETYRVPAALIREERAPRRVGRVFRDEEELAASSDLSAEIDAALEESDWLVVVCSPRTPESEWVNAEVRRFRELGRHDRILALLIEGEPSGSFPRSLVEIRRTVADPERGPTDRIEEVEPLAADVRPDGETSLRQRRRMAKLRLLATMLGCRFDDLRRRDQERRTRRVALLGALTLAVAIALGVLALVALGQKHEADYQRGVAEKKTREVAQRLAALYEDRGRTELLRGAPSRAATFLSSALSLERSTPSLRVLLGQSLIAPRALRYTLRGHSAPIRGVAFGPDGRQLVTVSDDKTAVVWDRAAGVRLRTLNGHALPIAKVHWVPGGARIMTSASGDPKAKTPGETVFWSVESGAMLKRLSGFAVLAPDGRRFVLHRSGNTARLMDTASLEEIAALGPHETPVLRAVFSADGSRVLTLSKKAMSNSYQNEYRLWDRDGSLLAHGTYDSEALTLEAEFSRDGRLLALEAAKVNEVDRPVIVLETKTGTVVSEPGKSMKRFWQARIAPDGSHLYTIDQEGDTETDEVRVWDLPGGDLQASLRHGARVSFAEISPDGTRMLTHGERWTGWLWELGDEPKLRATLRGHLAPIRRAALSPDGHFALTSSVTVIRVWDANSGAGLGVLDVIGKEIDDWWFAPDGSEFFVASDNSIHAFAWPGCLSAWPLHREDETLSVLAQDENRNRLVAGHADGTARVWDTRAQVPVVTTRLHEKAIVAAAFLPDGETVLTAGEDGLLRAWDSMDGALRWTVTRDQRAWRTLAVDNVGSRAVCVDDAGRVFLVDAKEGRVSGTLDMSELDGTGIRYEATSARFLDGDRRILTSGRGPQWSTLAVWDVKTGELLAQMVEGGIGSVRVLQRPGHDQVAILDHWSQQKTGYVRLWNVAGDENTTVEELHTRPITAMAFDLSGTRLATGSFDQSGRTWDLDTGRMTCALEGHRGALEDIAFQPDGDLVATCAADGTARLWDARSGTELARLDCGGSPAGLVFDPRGRHLVVRTYGGAALLWKVPIEEDATSAAALVAATSPWLEVEERLVPRDWSSPLARFVVGAEEPEAGDDIPTSAREPAAADKGKARPGKAASDETARITSLLPEAARPAWVAGSSAFRCGEPVVRSVGADAAGALVAVCFDYGTAAVFDASDGKLRKTFRCVPPMALAPDGRTLVAATADGRIRIRDTSDGTEKELEGLQSPRVVTVTEASTTALILRANPVGSGS